LTNIPQVANPVFVLRANEADADLPFICLSQTLPESILLSRQRTKTLCG
jgi:hypothetical protein